MVTSNQKPNSFLPYFGMQILLLSLLTILLRLFEHVSIVSQLTQQIPIQAFLYGLLNDLAFTLSVCLILCLPVFLLWQRKPAWAHLFFVVTSLIVILVQSALTRYYITTKTLLGADLFGYSMDDIKTTIGSSASFSFTDILPLVLIALFVLAARWLHRSKLKINPWASVALLVLGVTDIIYANPLKGKQGTASAYLSMNKTVYFISSNLVSSYKGKTLSFSGYPLQRQDNSTDALTAYFNLTAEKPNLVFIIVEGLGRDFTGPKAAYKGFTPFLDSLAGKSLYWSNCLSTSGRSFAGLPSIFGSLPFAKNGFSELGQNMPDHASLISLLKSNGYRTSFFYGGNANFDYQDVFLEQQGIDYILNENGFGANYSRSFGSKYSWGYADGDLYKKSLEVLAPLTKQPLLNIYFTLTTHEPFALPNEARYIQMVEKMLEKLSGGDRAKYSAYKEVFSALLYSDESIRDFMAAYAQRPDYANTIFVITGDHRLIPVQEGNSISRFHVPLLIYSPMLKARKNFTALSSHLDITPSFIQLLKHQPGMQFPSTVHWLGNGLDTGKTLNPAFQLALMRNKNMLEDFVQGDMLLSQNNLYRIRPDLTLEPYDNSARRDELLVRLDSFRQLNNYLCYNNKIYKDDKAVSHKKEVISFTDEELKTLAAIAGNIASVDTLFFKARDFAAALKYNEARLLCKKILMQSPNYHDVRVLFGRTYSWEKNYTAAIKLFKEVIDRDAHFEDAYLAWTDAERWSGNKKAALEVTRQGLKNIPASNALKSIQTQLLAAK